VKRRSGLGCVIGGLSWRSVFREREGGTKKRVHRVSERRGEGGPRGDEVEREGARGGDEVGRRKHSSTALEESRDIFRASYYSTETLCPVHEPPPLNLLPKTSPSAHLKLDPLPPPCLPSRPSLLSSSTHHKLALRPHKDSLHSIVDSNFPSEDPADTDPAGTAAADLEEDSRADLPSELDEGSVDPLSSSEETSNERRGERKEKGEEKGRPEICLSKAVEGVWGEMKEKEGGREGGGGDSKRAARFEAFFPRSIEGVPGPKQNEKKKLHSWEPVAKS